MLTIYIILSCNLTPKFCHKDRRYKFDVYVNNVDNAPPPKPSPHPTHPPLLPTPSPHPHTHIQTYIFTYTCMYALIHRDKSPCVQLKRKFFKKNKCIIQSLMYNSFHHLNKDFFLYYSRDNYVFTINRSINLIEFT